MGDKPYNEAQAAVRLGVSVRTLHNYVDLHGLPVQRVGRRTYYSEADIVSWLRKQRRGGSLIRTKAEA